jgi:MFS family permease
VTLLEDRSSRWPNPAPLAQTILNASAARPIVALLYFGYLLSFADRVIFGLVLNPIKTQLHLTDTQIGLLSGAAFALSYAVFSPIGGYFVDRRPRKMMLSLAVTFWSVATLVTGLANSFLTMGLARIGVGVGESLLHPIAVSLIADTTPAQRRFRAFSVYLSAGAAGSIVALLFGGMLVRRMGQFHGITLPILGSIAPWQGLFIAAAIPGFALALSVLLIMREPHRAPASRADAEHPTGFGFVRRYPRLAAAIFAGISLAQMGSYTITTWSVSFFERVHGWSGSRAAITLSLTSGVATLAGCLLAGPMIGALRRRGHQDAPLRLCLIGAAAHAGFAMAGLLANSPLLAIALLPLASFWGYVPSVAAFSALGEALPGPIRARLAGLHTFTNGVISNSLGPLLVGLFSDRLFARPGGLRYALVLTVFIAGLGGIGVVFSGLRQYRDRLNETAAL